MPQKRTGTLQAPGTELYYEVRGDAGPVLLLISGGYGDAAGFAPLAGLMADRFTVVAYDRRGNSRSVLTGPPTDLRMSEQSGDALEILDAVGAERAYVLGSSSGALVGLDLLARHPERIAGLVAHEPPALTLLPEGAEYLAKAEDLAALRKDRGAQAAVDAFMAGMFPPEGEPEFEPGFDWDPAIMDRMAVNAEVLFDRELIPSIGFRPDEAALAAVADRLVVGVGELSRDWPPACAGLELAASVGAWTVQFPGGHLGCLTRARAFAERLAEVLDGFEAGE
ncbi:MAG TPA: alpha/beta hydrolase [Actinocrinis sp.]|jgi:pimeloyl-ACP methyl ester carboxylesterase